MILLIDNYDSFSYNLYQAVGGITEDIKVIRNDEMTMGEIENLAPGAIIISPGPGRPEDAGVIVDVIKELGDKIPILGVCLGMQAMCIAYGAKVGYAPRLMHGKQSVAHIKPESRLFKYMLGDIKVGRYHSLALDEETITDELAVTARADDGTVMAIEHREYDVYGLQFHPESILTPDGQVILKRFMKIVESKGSKR